MARFRSIAGLLTVAVAIAATTASAQTPNISQLRKAAENGDFAAQYQLGIAHRDGSGVPVDLVEANVWLGLAAYFVEGEDGIRYRTATREVFERLTDDQARDATQRRLTLVRRLADDGRAWAQCFMGMAFYDSNPRPQDLEQAVRWFEKSAKQSYPMSQFMFGMALMQGKGVKADPVKGMDWLRKAAAQGHAHSQLVAGTFYSTGTGVPKDFALALEWWRKAAEQGLAEAQTNIGAAYLETDRGVPRDYRQAAQWFQRAADQGFPIAQAHLAGLYEKGLGVLQDVREALYWYRLAAGGGDTWAQYRLGLSYRDGGAVSADPVEAHKWLNLAASRAEGDHQKPFVDARDRLAQSMTSAQLGEAQKRAREWMATFERVGRVIDLSMLPPPPPPPSGPIRVGGEINPPAKTKDVEAVYPAIAQAARVQGVVILEATIDPTGKVVDVKPLGTPPPLLVQAAIDAVKQWEYRPTLLNGVPVSVIMTVTVKFALK